MSNNNSKLSTVILATITAAIANRTPFADAVENSMSDIKDAAREDLLGELMGDVSKVTKPTKSQTKSEKRSYTQKRTPEELEALQATFVATVDANPEGASIGAIAEAMEVETGDLTLVVRKALEAGDVAREGEKRGAVYFPAGEKRAYTPKRTPEELEALQVTFVATVNANPEGASIGAIAEAMGVETGDLTLVVRKAVDNGEVVREGEKRGAFYLPKPKKAKKAPKAKKETKKETETVEPKAEEGKQPKAPKAEKETKAA